jgi:hypothetical protein
MVTGLQSQHPARRRGALMTEAMIALGILAAVMLPVAFMFMQETKLTRVYYYKAVALEIVDGEMEVLAAGEWRAFQPGRQSYTVLAAAATNLPPGEFILTLDGKRARLEWIPKARNAGGVTAREVVLK